MSAMTWMARVAQQQLLVQLRPVLTTSRREDPVQKASRHWNIDRPDPDNPR